jgi:hypothetical protein
LRIAAGIAALHRLDDEGWARHANPWSGWTRFATCLPLLALAIWSRVWLGWWSLGAVALALGWIWLNPRVFAPARFDDAWMSRGVFGERLWIMRDQIPIPALRRHAPHVLTAVAALGVPVLIYGLFVLDVCSVLVGMFVITLGKLWFVDRMALLYQDVIAVRPDLRYGLPPAVPIA